MADQPPRLPSDPAELSEILAAGLRALVELIDRIEVPDGFQTEPSPAFRPLRARSP